MAELSGFFDAHASVDAQGNAVYDRTYLAESFARYFASFIGNGVYGGKSNELMVKQNDSADMSIKVLTGQAFINGYFYENTGELSLSIDNADGVLNRIDLIVLRWDKYERAIHLAVEKGVSSSSPSTPSLKRNDDYYELELAKVSVKAGATKITQADITDMRLDSEACGFVVGVVKQFDTAEFNAQLNAWTEEFKQASIDEIAALLAVLNEIIAANDLGPIISDIQNLKSFGLGNYLPREVSLSELDSIFDTGWYILSQFGTSLAGVGFNYANVLVYYTAINSCIQELRILGSNIMLRRNCHLGTWGEWCVENPPFEVDVEYRTTEHYHGVAVYKKTDANGNIFWRKEGESAWRLQTSGSSGSYVAPASIE